MDRLPRARSSTGERFEGGLEGRGSLIVEREVELEGAASAAPAERRRR